MIEISDLFRGLRYDVLNGGFLRGGDRAGTYDKDGYRIIKIGGKSYKEHHLVWFYFYTVWPGYLHHINGVRDDNRLCNLEQCTHAENMKSKLMYKNNKTGFVGVDFHKGKDVYRARDGQKHIGYYDTIEEAVEARKSYLQMGV